MARTKEQVKQDIAGTEKNIDTKEQMQFEIIALLEEIRDLLKVKP